MGSATQALALDIRIAAVPLGCMKWCSRTPNQSAIIGIVTAWTTDVVIFAQQRVHRMCTMAARCRKMVVHHPFTKGLPSSHASPSDLGSRALVICILDIL